MSKSEIIQMYYKVMEDQTSIHTFCKYAQIYKKQSGEVAYKKLCADLYNADVYMQ